MTDLPDPNEHDLAKLMWMVEGWSEEPLSGEDARLVYDYAPFFADVYKRRAPATYPDGQPTYIEQHLDNLAMALQWAILDAPTDGDWATASAILFHMKLVSQPDNIPLQVGYLNSVLNVREALSGRFRAENLSAFEAAIAVNMHWFKLNGQFDRYADAMLGANTEDAVRAVVIEPPAK